MIRTNTALMVLTLIATISIGNAYAIEGDGTSHVEVDEYVYSLVGYLKLYINLDIILRVTDPGNVPDPTYFA